MPSLTKKGVDACDIHIGAASLPLGLRAGMTD